MKIEVKETQVAELDAGLLVAALLEEGELPAELAAAPGAGDAKGGFKKTAMLHPESGPRTLVVGLGKEEDLDAERVRVLAALAAKRAASLEATAVAWLPPDGLGADTGVAEGVVTGTILGAYRFDRFRSADPDDPPPPAIESLTLIAPNAAAAAAEAARICAEAQNRARDLQILPSNFATPSYLGRRAREA